MAETFVPPKKPEFLKYVKIPLEGLEMLQTTDSKAHYDKLCGAIVRYTCSGEREAVPKCIQVQYMGLLPIINKIRQGGKNQKGSNHDSVPTGSEEGFDARRDENASSSESERDAFPWDSRMQSERENEVEIHSRFGGVTNPQPAETYETVGNQPNGWAYDEPHGEAWNEPTSQPESESEYACERKDCEYIKSKKQGTQSHELTEAEKTKLRVEAQKLVVVCRYNENNAKRLVYEQFKKNGLDGVTSMVSNCIEAHKKGGGC